MYGSGSGQRYTRGVRVLGIDPGYDRCGYGIVEFAKPGALKLVASGLIKTGRSDPMCQRLRAIAVALAEVIALWKPDCVAVEELFFAKNVKTGIGVAQARGVVLERSAAAGLEVSEYPPTMVKNQLTGNGRATKQQVDFMVRKMVDVGAGDKLDDELDAIGVALCHAYRAAIPGVLK